MLPGARLGRVLMILMTLVIVLGLLISTIAIPQVD
jgi:hypothetical protein